jgi:hypothetical protein
LLEIWAGRPQTVKGPVTTAELAPRFRIVGQKGSAKSSTVDEFSQRLSRIRLMGRKAVVTTTTAARCSPPGMAPIIGSDAARAMGCQVYGLEVTPIYRDPETDELFPRVLRELCRRLTVALRQAFFEFARTSTTQPPAHFHALGRRAMVKAVWDVDRMLADVSERYDFLLQVTPVNGEQAWHEFERRGFERRPTFHYRPLPAEPVVLKREAYKAPVWRKGSTTWRSRSWTRSRREAGTVGRLAGSARTSLRRGHRERSTSSGGSMRTSTRGSRCDPT